MGNQNSRSTGLFQRWQYRLNSDHPDNEDFKGMEFNVGWVRDDGKAVLFEANTNLCEGDLGCCSFAVLVNVGKPAKTIQRRWRQYKASKSATNIQRVWRGHDARWKCPMFSFKETDGEVRPAKRQRTE